MLARRFTIVCLIAALFGIGLAMLVAESRPSTYALNQHVGSGCAPVMGVNCLPTQAWQDRPFR